MESETNKEWIGGHIHVGKRKSLQSESHLCRRLRHLGLGILISTLHPLTGHAIKNLYNNRDDNKAGWRNTNNHCSNRMITILCVRPMVCTHYMPKACLYKRMAFEMHRKNLIAGFADAMRFVSIIQCSQNLCPLAFYSHYNFDR